MRDGAACGALVHGCSSGASSERGRQCPRAVAEGQRCEACVANGRCCCILRACGKARPPRCPDNARRARLAECPLTPTAHIGRTVVWVFVAGLGEGKECNAEIAGCQPQSQLRTTRVIQSSGHASRLRWHPVQLGSLSTSLCSMKMSTRNPAVTPRLTRAKVQALPSSCNYACKGGSVAGSRRKMLHKAPDGGPSPRCCRRW